MSILRNDQPRSALFGTLAGLCGALAIASYAGAAHGGDNHLGTIAPMLLGHAPALLVLSLIVPNSRGAKTGVAFTVCGVGLLF